MRVFETCRLLLYLDLLSKLGPVQWNTRKVQRPFQRSTQVGPFAGGRSTLTSFVRFGGKNLEPIFSLVKFS
jgi:hypothetical protein